MTDQFEVGEAAARAPRLENADVLLIERELDELERRCADANDPQPLMTRLWAGKAIQQLRAARAPRAPLEPAVEQLALLTNTMRTWNEEQGSVYEVLGWIDDLEHITKRLVAARSALPQHQTAEETEDTRVETFNPRVEMIGSTADLSPGNATAAERTDLIEALAAYAHEAWAGWMRHLFKKCGVCVDADTNAEDRLIPAVWYERWLRQVNTPYAELREDERESDRKEARRMLAIVQSAALPRVPEPDLEPIEAAYREIGTFVDSMDASGVDVARTEFLDRVWQAVPKLIAEIRALRAARAGAEAPPVEEK